MDTVMLRCSKCGTVNRVIAEKLGSTPHCGSCGTTLSFPHAPVDVTEPQFDAEVLRWPGIVLLEFWNPG